MIEAAVRLMARDGAAYTTMTAICHEAGISERYFYESFPSREHALVSALTTVCEEIALMAVDAAARTPGAPVEQIRASFVALARVAVNEPDRARVAVIESNSTSALRERRRELLSAYADIFCRQVEEIFPGRVWPPDRARLNGIMFIAGLSELIASWLSGSVELTAEQFVDIATDLLMTIGPRPAPSLNAALPKR